MTPFQGYEGVVCLSTQGSAALHPGLSNDARSGLSSAATTTDWGWRERPTTFCGLEEKKTGRSSNHRQVASLYCSGHGPAKGRSWPRSPRDL
jgi:hypothetical protein